MIKFDFSDQGVRKRLLCCDSISLVKYSDASDTLHGNPFVQNGYRNKLSTYLCLKSLFNWNNDTINIWSHLTAFLLFFIIMMRDIATLMSTNWKLNEISDIFILILGLICFQFCLMSSTVYHLFRCHQSIRLFHRLLALDMSGIIVGLLGCYLPGIHLGFYCLSIWRDIYLVIIVSFFIGIFYWLLANDHSLHKSKFNSALILFVLISLYGIIPAIHWVYLNGFYSPIVQKFAPHIILVYFLAGCAFLFFVSKFPERIFPGKFDYIGSSHQCWHIIIVALFFTWYQAGQKLLEYRKENKCLQ